MQTLLSPILCIFLYLIASSAALAQFSEKNEAFQQPGAGAEDREYMFLVPEGVTVVTRKGEEITGGQTIGIPGSLITLLSASEAEETITQGDLFNEFKEKNMTTEQKQEFAVIAIRVPEGASIRHEDGRSIEGESTITLMVTTEHVKVSDTMAESPGEIRAAGTGGFQHR